MSERRRQLTQKVRPIHSYWRARTTVVVRVWRWEYGCYRFHSLERHIICWLFCVPCLINVRFRGIFRRIYLSLAVQNRWWVRRKALNSLQEVRYRLEKTNGRYHIQRRSSHKGSFWDLNYGALPGRDQLYGFLLARLWWRELLAHPDKRTRHV